MTKSSVKEAEDVAKPSMVTSKNNTLLSKLASKTLSLITSDHALRNILLLAFALCAPGLLVDIHTDDYWHYGFIKDAIPLNEIKDLSLFGLFSFANADPERFQQLIDLGFLPWWSYEGYKLMFWRPLTEATHWIDYTFWPSHGGLMHFQSILWYLGLLAVLFKLYGRMHSGKVAVGMALLLYAVDASHAVNVTWIAGRNALTATLFGVAVLYFHIRARQDAWLPGYGLAMLSLIVGLLSAEYHIAVGAYLFAFAVTLDKKGPIKGILCLLPYLAVVAAWWVIYKSSGFGSGGTNGFYLDPVEDPITYLLAMGHRIVALMGTQWGFVPADLYRGGARPYIFGFSVVLLLGVVYLLVPVLKESKAARFWGIGMVISALPVCIPPPSDRLLMYVGVGACGMLGAFFQYWFDQHNKGEMIAKSRVNLAKTMIGFHIFFSGLLFPAVIYSTQITGDGIRESSSTIVDNNAIENKKLVLLNAPAWLNGYLYSIWVYEAEPLPEKIWGLTTWNTIKKGNEGFLTTLNNHEVRVSLKDGFLTSIDKIYRDYENYTLNVGHVLKFGGMSVRIVELTDDLRPKTVDFIFEQTLDDPDLIWLIYNEDDEFVPFAIPGVGETVPLKV